jgi:hypothetical protein
MLLKKPTGTTVVRGKPIIEDYPALYLADLNDQSDAWSFTCFFKVVSNAKHCRHPSYAYVILHEVSNAKPCSVIIRRSRRILARGSCEIKDFTNLPATKRTYSKFATQICSSWPLYVARNVLPLQDFCDIRDYSSGRGFAESYLEISRPF